MEELRCVCASGLACSTEVVQRSTSNRCQWTAICKLDKAAKRIPEQGPWHLARYNEGSK